MMNLWLTLRELLFGIVVCVDLTASSSTNQYEDLQKVAVSTVGQPRLDLKETCASIGLVHVGKTGGSSVRCMLRPRLREDSCKAKPIFGNESGFTEQNSIFLEVSEVCHMASCSSKEWFSFLRRKPCIIVTVRNPLDRILSWWKYERAIAKQHGLNDTIYDCYGSLEDLALGLQVANRATSFCTSLARKCIIGEVKCHHGHNFYNYAYYYKNALLGHLSSTHPLKEAISHRVFAIRNMYKWSDAENINVLFGRSPKSF